MIFQYDGRGLWNIVKLWSSVEISVQSDDEGFKLEMTPMPHQMTYQNGSPDTGFHYIQEFHNGLIYKIHYVLDALMSSDSASVVTRVKITPYGQHFVKVCYHGSKWTAIFSISVKETCKSK